MTASTLVRRQNSQLTRCSFLVGTMVAIFNARNYDQTMQANFAEIPGLEADGSYSVLDVWTGDSMGCKSGSVSVDVDSHDTAVLLVQEAC